jgi:hypothetical protein
METELGFTGCGKRVISIGVAALSGRIHYTAVMYGLKAVPFKQSEFFRSRFTPCQTPILHKMHVQR